MKTEGARHRKLLLKSLSRLPRRYGLYQPAWAEVFNQKNYQKDYQKKLPSISSAKQLLVFSLGRATLYKFFSETILNQFFKDRELLVSVDFEKLQVLERENLCQDVFGYLAKGEKSPLALQHWLQKRAVSKELRESIFEEALAKNFLSPERFAQFYARKRYKQASHPWHRTARELANLGIEEPVLQANSYDDLAMLEGYWFLQVRQEQDLLVPYSLDEKKFARFEEKKRKILPRNKPENENVPSQQKVWKREPKLLSEKEVALEKLMKQLQNRGFSFSVCLRLLEKIRQAQTQAQALMTMTEED